jgi:hypothetical protein
VDQRCYDANPSPAAKIGTTLTAVHYTGDGADELPIHALAGVSEMYKGPTLDGADADAAPTRPLTFAAVSTETRRWASLRTSEKRRSGSRNWFA